MSMLEIQKKWFTLFVNFLCVCQAGEESGSPRMLVGTAHQASSLVPNIPLFTLRI